MFFLTRSALFVHTTSSEQFQNTRPFLSYILKLATSEFKPGSYIHTHTSTNTHPLYVFILPPCGVSRVWLERLTVSELIQSSLPSCFWARHLTPLSWHQESDWTWALNTQLTVSFQTQTSSLPIKHLKEIKEKCANSISTEDESKYAHFCNAVISRNYFAYLSCKSRTSRQWAHSRSQLLYIRKTPSCSS